MMAPFDNIVQHLFHQPSLQSVTVGELERMVEQHPSFAAAQFLLLKKMQDTAHPDFTSQLHKTTLYFNNPLWLQFLLQPLREKEALVTQKEYPVIDKKENRQQPVEIEKTLEQNEAFHTTSTIITDEQTEEKPVLAATEQPEQTIHSETNTAIAEEYHHTPLAETAITTEQRTEETSYEPVSAIALAEEYNYHLPATPGTVQEQPVEILPEEAKDTNAEAVNEINIPEQQTIENNEQSFEAEPPEVKKEDPILFRTIIETPAAKEDMLFEPYHTIDYFASQGIKLSKIDPEPQDRLGKQLKSFTEWLKGMKKLPQVSVDKMLAENEESEVVADASHSIETKEVITEAMAEVFEKQGLHEKAAEVYHKLSLQNPSKSAYFASRMEALKQQ